MNIGEVTPQQNEKATRPWYQFSLRALMVFITQIAAAIGFIRWLLISQNLYYLSTPSSNFVKPGPYWVLLDIPVYIYLDFSVLTLFFVLASIGLTFCYFTKHRLFWIGWLPVTFLIEIYLVGKYLLPLFYSRT